MLISKRISQISPSTTLAIAAQEKKMKAEGIDVVGFGAGEPDFDTPEHIKEAARQALEQGFTKYTPAGGIKELKEAVCSKFKEDNNLDYSLGEVIISCGAKHSLFNAILAVCEEGEEVILPAPYWLSYPEMIRVAGAKTKILETHKENNFKIQPSELSKVINNRTKLLILNTPSNPTGMLYTKEELGEIAGILIKHNLFCLSDEIYEKIIYDSHNHVSIASLGTEIKKHTIVINGVSKSYSMTGWRIGYAAGPAEIIKAMDSLQSHSTSNPASIAQKAALAALSGPQKELRKMKEEFQRRRDFITEGINKISGLSCLKPQGAFYLFVDISKLFGRTYRSRTIWDSLSFTEILLSEARVAVVPGSIFGADSYIRLSFATSMENITKGLERIAEFVSVACSN